MNLDSIQGKIDPQNGSASRTAEERLTSIDRDFVAPQLRNLEQPDVPSPLLNRTWTQLTIKSIKDIVEGLIKDGADVDLRDAQGKTSLEFLVQYYSTLWRISSDKEPTLDLIKLLVLNHTTQLTLIEKTNYFDDAELKKLVQGARLLEAAIQKNSDEAKKLIAAGATIDFIDKEYKSALYYLKRIDNEDLQQFIQKSLNERLRDAIKQMNGQDVRRYLNLQIEIEPATLTAALESRDEPVQELFLCELALQLFLAVKRTDKEAAQKYLNLGAPFDYIYKGDPEAKTVLEYAQDEDKEWLADLLKHAKPLEVQQSMWKKAWQPIQYAGKKVLYMSAAVGIVAWRRLSNMEPQTALQVGALAGRGLPKVGPILDGYLQSCELRESARKPDRHSFKVAKIITHQDVFSREEPIVAIRRERAFESVKKFLNDQGLSLAQTPSIAFCFSGGGARATLETLGFLKGAHDLGILDSAQYATGLSGSTWALNPWLASGIASIDDYIQQVPARLSKPLDEYLKSLTRKDLKQIVKALARMYYSGQSVGIVTVYGLLLAHMFMKNLPGLENPFAVTMSSLKSKMESGQFPFMLSTAVVGGKVEEGYRKTVEFSPVAIGSFDAPSFIKPWALGRRFFKGLSPLVEPQDLYVGEKKLAALVFKGPERNQHKEDAVEEKSDVEEKSENENEYFGHELPLGYLMGIFGSALSFGTHDVLLTLLEKMGFEARDEEGGAINSGEIEAAITLLKKVIAQFSGEKFSNLASAMQKYLPEGKHWETLTDAEKMKLFFEHENYIAESINNFGPGTLSDSTTISLVDGGFQLQGTDRLNIGIMPLLERKLDVIVISDASLDLIGAPALRAAEVLAGKKGLPFPKINYATIDEKHISLHYDDRPGTPIIVYMPGIKNDNFDSKYDPTDTKTNPTGTTNFHYPEAASRKLMDLIAYNVRESKEKLQEAFRTAVERKKERQKPRI